MLTYATPSNTLITLASLAQGSARESTIIDNSTTRYDDFLFQFWFQTTMGAIADDKAVYIYFYGANSAGTFPATPALTGTDAAVVMAVNSSYNLGNPLVLSALNTQTTMRSEPVSVGQFFGGAVPSQWGFVVYNRTTLAFHPTEGNHGHAYQGIYYVGT